MWRCGALVFSCMKPPGGRTLTKGRYLFSVLHVYYLHNCNVEHLGAGHMPSLQIALAIATPGQPPWYRILEMTRQRRPGRSNCMHRDPSSTHEALRAFCPPPTHRNLLLSVCDAKHLVHRIISLPPALFKPFDLDLLSFGKPLSSRQLD